MRTTDWEKLRCYVFIMTLCFITQCSVFFDTVAFIFVVEYMPCVLSWRWQQSQASVVCDIFSIVVYRRCKTVCIHDVPCKHTVQCCTRVQYSTLLCTIERHSTALDGGVRRLTTLYIVGQHCTSLDKLVPRWTKFYVSQRHCTSEHRWKVGVHCWTELTSLCIVELIGTSFGNAVHRWTAVYMTGQVLYIGFQHGRCLFGSIVHRWERCICTSAGDLVFFFFFFLRAVLCIVGRLCTPDVHYNQTPYLSTSCRNNAATSQRVS